MERGFKKYDGFLLYEYIYIYLNPVIVDNIIPLFSQVYIVIFKIADHLYTIIMIKIAEKT